MNTMSGVANESAAGINQAMRRVRRGTRTLREALTRLVDGIPCRALIACTVLVLGGVSAAYAVIAFKSVPETSVAALPEDPASDSVGGVRPKCSECGVVESMRELARVADERGPAVAGAPKHRHSERAPRIYEVTLRMKDGRSHRFTDTNPANWRLGERVILIGEASGSGE